MKPDSKREQQRYYRILEIATYCAILFVALHMGQVEEEDFLNKLLGALNRMAEAPLDIFPIDWGGLFYTALFGLLGPLLIHTEYLRKRDLMPGQESGSAQWNEDYKKYYLKFAEVNVAWPSAFDKFKILVKIKGLLQKIGSVLDKIPVIDIFYRQFILLLNKGAVFLDETPGGKNMIFSDNVFMSTNTRKTMRNNNILVIGGSGTGKSRFVVKPNLLQANCSYVITDPSGELLETMGTYLENMGYEIRVFNLTDMAHSNCYNPFNYIRNEEGVLTMITALIKNTTPEGKSAGDPFWEKAETALLQALCFFLVSECNPEDRNFSNVMKLLRCAEVREGQEDFESTLDVMFAVLKERDPEHIAVRQYAVFKQAAGKTAQSILVSCSVRLTVFNMQSIHTLTGQDNIDLASIGDKKVALFCITPVADTTFNFLVALLYTQLFETLYFHAETECKGKRLSSHVRFMLDEFANIGTIPEFSQKLATMRKYEISCTIIIQALSQIKAMYKDDWEVLIGNCDSLLFLGGSDQTTLEYISKRLGKKTIRTQNNSRSYGKQGSYSMSYNKAGRELLTTDEIAVMDNKNCILFIRGQYPFFTTKYDYPRHPNYHMTGDANDKNIFDVKNVITGQLKRVENKNSENARMLEENAQRADTKTAEREHKVRNRPVRKKSMDGSDLCVSKPTHEMTREIAETSNPCELAKSIVYSNKPEILDDGQFGMLSQYCSQEEVEHLQSVREEKLRKYKAEQMAFEEQQRRLEEERMANQINASGEVKMNPEQTVYQMASEQSSTEPVMDNSDNSQGYEPYIPTADEMQAANEDGYYNPGDESYNFDETGSYEGYENYGSETEEDIASRDYDEETVLYNTVEEPVSEHVNSDFTHPNTVGNGMDAMMDVPPFNEEYEVLVERRFQELVESAKQSVLPFMNDREGYDEHIRT